MQLSQIQTYNHSIQLPSFTDNDIVNYDDWLNDAYHQAPQQPELKPFLMHDHGFTLCIVFAEDISEALDIAVDNDKLDRYAVKESDIEPEFLPDNVSVNSTYEYCEESIMRLGNASEPFDLDSLQVIELPPIKPSFLHSFQCATK